EIEMITDEEKDLICNSFNDVNSEFPKDKTVAELFEEQVEKNTDNIAVVYEEEKLTYGELNSRANSLAYKLRELGVKPDDFVAVVADRSKEMIVGVMGAIKAGGAYVPIDPTYPEERIKYMLDDCKPKAILTYIKESELKLEVENIPVINLADSSNYSNETQNPERVATADNLAYVIYTSGTTGQPKGVMIENRCVSGLVTFYQQVFNMTNQDRLMQYASFCFDQSVGDIFGTILNGAELHIASSALRYEIPKLGEYMVENKITAVSFTPKVIRELSPEKFPDLRFLDSGGEAGELNVLKQWSKGGRTVMNAYGPTEATVNATYTLVDETTEKLHIGKSIVYTNAYIVNEENKLCGIGVQGELCISGDGLARGYLNRPELTAEKFIDNPFGEGKLYKTGDLAKWLPDGNIDFLGRIDEQVKIRGFRIELGEIESKIKEISYIKDSAVIVRSDKGGDKAIYAYYTSDIEVNAIDIRKKLSETLPEYMIPSYMMQIEIIPITKNGKLDKRALPEIDSKTTREYIAPRTESEKVICEIFGEILGAEKVGINDGFFELGGHSLRATRLVNSIEAKLGVKVALKDVFSHTTPEQLAKIIDGSTGEEYVPIPKAEEKEYYPMSSAQKRTYLIQQMEPEAITYNMPQSMKLEGEVYPEKLKSALQEMTDRHEILRTAFLTVDGECVQKILPNIEADFEYISESTKSDEEIYNEFVRPFDLSDAKNVKVMLVNKGEYHLLLIDMHHIISDGMSETTFTEELIALYNGEKLEPLTHQFKDYSEWMRTRDLSSQKEYWVNEFSDEIPVLDMPLDYARPQMQSYNGASAGIPIDKETYMSINELAQKTGTTPYMIFLSALMIMLSKYSRQEDIVVGSPISGRTHKDTEKMLGMFVNTLAMRGRPEGNKKYSDFLAEIKASCLKAYENQEYPFEELVENVDVNRDMSRNPLFDVMLVMQNNENIKSSVTVADSGEVENSLCTAKFDLEFGITENGEQFLLTLVYCSDLFTDIFAKKLLNNFAELIKNLMNSYDAKINQIEMITAEEKDLICNNFNATEKSYPSEKTVVEMFEEQVEKTPENTAVIFEGKSITYKELNERANVIAHNLRAVGVKPDDLVA
ncbi:MAG: amino acid adenylation domain-containing protein, partial [Acutalibacteraceae bacterium]|nr:amino acid adenylation domain-containing protein [Acutalibacteraceae bacterium]